MERDIILGMIIIFVGLGFMTYLIWWSRRMVDRIAGKHLSSIREIVKELNHDK